MCGICMEPALFDMQIIQDFAVDIVISLSNCFALPHFSAFEIGPIFWSNPFLLHHYPLSVKLLPKNKSVLQRLISNAASSLSQLPTTSQRRRIFFQ